jgi:signal transduction histidine kinase/DNA-binding response OmpR family regulator
MKIQDTKISLRLCLSLGVVLALVTVLAWEALTHTDALWTQTQTIYDHPLMVRRAVGAFELDAMTIQRDTYGLVLAAGRDQEIAALLAAIEASKTDAFRQLDVLEDRYLGPKEDIAALRAAFVEWNMIRDETVRLLRLGKVQEAADRVQTGGIGGTHAKRLYELTAEVSAFSLNKGDVLFREATALKQSLNQRLYLYTGVILVIILLISYFLFTSIRDPLRLLTEAADRFRQGSMEARSGYGFSNEFGTLAAAFDSMAERVEAETHLKDKAVQLVAATSRETEARAFCRELLTALVNQTGSQMGAVYLLNPQQTAFEHFESIGLGDGGRAAFSAETREGEFGAALATGQVQHITAIPDDARFTFATVSGEFRPREIITIPVLADHTTTAVISLASVRAYDASAVQLVNNVWATIAARLNGVLLFRQIHDQAARLEEQNRELAAQKLELSGQANELNEMNAELTAQSRQLAAASRLKSVFLANMSHELRTPLNSVIVLSEVLGRRLAGKVPDEEHGYLEIIERNGRHLLALINDILDLSRIEAGREELNCGDFELRTLVDEVVEMLEPLAREKGLTLLNRIDHDLPLLHSDPEKLRHILQNLAGNAVKFTETGSVEIIARQEGGELHIAVSDTGIGIPAEALPHVFEEFHQVDNSASRRYGGNGLGLAIARKYSRLLAGDIDVESTPGQGSTFTLRLPWTLSLPQVGDTRSLDTEHRPLSNAKAGPPVASAGRRILLVEDSEAVMIQMTEMLGEQGYAVRTAKNGVEAIARIAEEQPEAVILDLMMPEMDGFAVLKAIRGMEQTAALPVLILTARQVTRDELSFLKHNHIHQLIRKGDIRRGELLAAVAGLFAPPAAAEPKKRRPIRRRTVSGKPVVLVVEDNPDNLRTIRALLRDTCTVLEAGDGLSGVEQARRHVPDLILMDLALPVMDGLAALAAIREDEALCDIPVVAVTASAMKGDRESILAQGFDGYLSKPIEAELLERTVNEVLHGNA